MKNYKLHLRYVYTFYNLGEILAEDVFDEYVEVLGEPHRFTLHDQEDSSFIVSELRENHKGKHVTVTYPNKDMILVYLSDETELVYDEYYSAMGDDNHNVYEGTFSLVCE